MSAEAYQSERLDVTHVRLTQTASEKWWQRGVDLRKEAALPEPEEVVARVEQHVSLRHGSRLGQSVLKRTKATYLAALYGREVKKEYMNQRNLALHTGVCFGWVRVREGESEAELLYVVLLDLHEKVGEGVCDGVQVDTVEEDGDKLHFVVLLERVEHCGQANNVEVVKLGEVCGHTVSPEG